MIGWRKIRSKLQTADMDSPNDHQPIREMKPAASSDAFWDRIAVRNGRGHVRVERQQQLVSDHHVFPGGAERAIKPHKRSIPVTVEVLSSILLSLGRRF